VQDVHTVPIIIDHPDDPANLPFNFGKALKGRLHPILHRSTFLSSVAWTLQRLSPPGFRHGEAW
jgi:hypothetical protein